MALIKCNDCGKEISEYAEFCPHCGAKNAVAQSYAQNSYHSGQVNPDCWEYGGGAKFWMGLCMAAQALTGILVLSQSQVLAGLLGIASAVCFGILWFKKNVYGFYGVCAIAVIMVIINFSNNVGIFSLTGLINPLITFLVIKKYHFSN